MTVMTVDKVDKRMKRIVFRIRWMTMSPRERYAYLLARGGLLQTQPK